MTRFALFLPLMLVAACGNEPEIEMENATVGEVASEMRKQAGGTFVRAGKWEQTITLLNVEAPGMPPEARDMM